jgi:hypothetical protein
MLCGVRAALVSVSPRPLSSVVALLAILVGSSPASGRKPPQDTLLPPALRDSFAESVSYAAVPIVALATKQERDFIGERVGVVGPEDYRGHTIPEEKLAADDSLWRVGAVPALEKLVPGAVVFRRSPRSDMRPLDPRCYIVYRDSVFGVSGLNRLLRYAKVSFDTSTMVARARVAVLLVEALHTRSTVMDGLREGTRPDTIGTTAVPQVSFLSVKVENPVAGRVDIAKVSFDVLRAGMRVEQEVVLWRYPGGLAELRFAAGLQVDELGAPAVRGMRGELPPRDDAWSVTLTGDTWSEYWSPHTHVFAVALDNSTPTNGVLTFRVSGAGNVTPFVNFRAVMPQTPEFAIRCVSSGSDTVATWVTDSALTSHCRITVTSESLAGEASAGV